MTRIPPELHRQVNVAALVSGKSLNAWVTEQLLNAVQRFVVIKAAGRKAAAQAKAVKKIARRRKDDPGLRRVRLSPPRRVTSDC